MTPPGAERAGSERAVEALLRLREIEDQDARLRLQQIHMDVARLEREIFLLERRCESVVRRGGDRVLHERILLDALLRITLERRRELKDRKHEAEGVLEEYLRVKGQKDAVHSLQKRRRLEREALEERRADEVACDMAASGNLRDIGDCREGPCES